MKAVVLRRSNRKIGKNMGEIGRWEKKEGGGNKGD